MNKASTSVSPSVPVASTQAASLSTTASMPATGVRKSGGGLKELDALGQDLLKQSLGDTPSQSQARYVWNIFF